MRLEDEKRLERMERRKKQVEELVRKKRENQQAREEAVVETYDPLMGRQITVRPFLPHDEIPIHDLDHPGWINVAGGQGRECGGWGKPRMG